MRLVLRLSSALTVALLLASPAAAQVLNFDDITQGELRDVYVPQSYHGFTFGGNEPNCGIGQCSWLTNLGFWNPSFPLSVSGPVSVWANNAASLTIARPTAFNFQSAYIGAKYGCNDETVVTVRGFLGGLQTNTRDVSLSCDTFGLQSFDFNNVDMIQFDQPSPKASLILDDISFSTAATTVPEPTTFALMAFGALVIGGVTRTRKKS